MWGSSSSRWSQQSLVRWWGGEVESSLVLTSCALMLGQAWGDSDRVAGVVSNARDTYWYLAISTERMQVDYCNCLNKICDWKIRLLSDIYNIALSSTFNYYSSSGLRFQAQQGTSVNKDRPLLADVFQLDVESKTGNDIEHRNPYWRGPQWDKYLLIQHLLSNCMYNSLWSIHDQHQHQSSAVRAVHQPRQRNTEDRGKGRREGRHSGECLTDSAQLKDQYNISILCCTCSASFSSSFYCYFLMYCIC